MNDIDNAIGPCHDKIQRIKDLYIVNTTAQWTMNQLRVLGDMAQAHGLPMWFVDEVFRIRSKSESVASLEAKRRNKEQG